MVFIDPDYPGHYAVPAAARRLSDEQQTQLTIYLQKSIESTKQS
jgi:hypothetical protein